MFAPGTEKVDLGTRNDDYSHFGLFITWIASRISEILGSEDDVVIELCYNLIESSRFPDIKGLQIQLTGFLDKETPGFCKELWNLCLSAQASPQGVPKELLEAKKRELMQEKIEAEKAAEERQKREAQSFRGRGDGRSDSYRGGGRGRGRGGGFGDRDMNDRRGGFNRGRDGSRSPPPRGGAGGDSYRAPRRDIYVPRGRRNSMGRRGDTKRRSPSRSPSVDSGSSRSRTRSASSASSNRSPSRSRSPPPRPEAEAAAAAVAHLVARMANLAGAIRGEGDHQRAAQARRVHEVAVAGAGAMAPVAPAKTVAAAAPIGSDRKRRQSPSISPPRESRDKSADGSRTKDRPTPQPHTGDPDSTAAASSPSKARKVSVDKDATLLREKELKERILQMRSSKSGPSNA
ncbi:hypothetical protein MGG_04513 [Pyricularia oryzae 70-15]|uniref:PWI domain-containing protein n=1 Tax=Pyricularia oryzae (strain 70-15 / ATCC MYA-4617 / FGSC 8958) TaxID=242507 RepID=G4MSE1_PYRO7|nr:uncharacterized protein MGG_04513 [Pyricularia oryzae 70-15]EHA53753.1 hypothetical protein MGG_04513 [Pyricularia oryzae 70-15]